MRGSGAKYLAEKFLTRIGLVISREKTGTVPGFSLSTLANIQPPAPAQ
jgi:hypothetical protein